MLSLLVDHRHLRETYDRLGRLVFVERTEAAILLVVLAMAAMMMPESSPFRSQLACSPELEHFDWLTLADKIKPVRRFERLSKGSSTGWANQHLLLEITLEMVFVLYFSHAGRDDELWDSLGSAIRKGSRISLFDERHVLWKSLSEQECLRQRKVALCIALTDSWAAFHRMRPPAIHLSNLHLDFTTHGNCREGIFPLVGELDPRQIAVVHRCQSFILNYQGKPAASRYVEASLLCEEIKATTGDILASMGIHVPVDVLPSLISTVAEDQRIALLGCISTSSYCACIVTRRFLTDANAPSDIRFVSLQHAQNILATVPVW